MVVWQQLIPLQLLLPFMALGMLLQMDMHPQITTSFASFSDAKLLQPMAMNLFLDWEKTTRHPPKLSNGLVFVPLEQLKNLG